MRFSGCSLREVNARVLIVDDEVDFVELVAFNMKRRGYEVLTASDGAEALSKARKFLPDLIILDVMLPELDGLSVCEILRSQPSTETIPVLMCTALSGEIARLNGAGAGADEFHSKPFKLGEFLACVDRLLQQRPGKVRVSRGV